MNIVFVNYHNFQCNSAVHIFNLANQLADQGHRCAVLVPDAPDTVAALGVARFQSLTYAEALAGRLPFPTGGGPSLVHGWTPRECVRAVVEALSKSYQCPYFVHLEDNEEVLTAAQLGTSWQHLLSLAARDLDRMVTNDTVHPHRYRRFLSRAKGITVLIDRLLEFKPDGVPGLEFWPAFESDLFAPQPADPGLIARLQIPAGHFVVVYPGNAHTANAEEMRSLYLAIAAVNRLGYPVTLVRLGVDYVDFLGSDLAPLRRHVVAANWVPHHEIPRYLALADVLIQPGQANGFNDYRFPSKLPEFFAMGLPVILPKSNVGHHVRDGEDALLLHEGSAIEIADHLARLLADADLRHKLGQAARCFAGARFNWGRSAANLAEFYSAQLCRLTVTSHKLTLEYLVLRYRNFAPPELSYATVADYSDSQDHVPILANIANDLKDVQRPWIFKAILGRVPRGGRLLEIGGGDPFVADLLEKLGYEVWVVDPYEGLGNGPTAFEAIKSSYPDVKFIRGWFPDALLNMGYGKFDCVYSISVLEHVPDHLIEVVASAVPLHVRSGGWSIHAVDHVTLGNSATEHRRRLAMMTKAFGLSVEALDHVIELLEKDADTFYLSADGHNLWRGSIPYKDFPMRRCVSIQFCQKRGGQNLQ